VCPGLNVSRALGPRSLVGMNSARFLIRLSERRSDLLLSTLLCRLVIEVGSDEDRRQGVASRSGSFLDNSAQMMRAFLAAIATQARW
jgi:hypothetical protein